MSKSPHTDTRKYGVRRVNGFALPASSSDSFVEALRHFSAKFIAAKAKASPRTVEGWKQGKSAPQGRHVLAMLSDDELCRRLLKAAGQGDLAKRAEILSLNRRITALKAAEAAHGEETNELRRGLEMGNTRRVVAGGTSQQRGETLAPDNGVVSRAPK